MPPSPMPPPPPTSNPGPGLRPLAELPVTTARRIAHVFCDIDDTLTTEGRLPAAAYGALEALQDAGLRVVPVTGRPAGWCDLIARYWPVDAVIGENGAFYFRYDAVARRMVRRYMQDAGLRAANRARLAALAAEILEQVPGAAIAADQPYRESDVAIDYCEDVAPLAPEAVARIAALFEAAGAIAKVSSIHVNGWFGAFDKLRMAERLFAEIFGLTLAEATPSTVYVGDSPNDAPMFAHFPNSVGVANVLRFRETLTALPAFVTSAAGGAGFAELARMLIDARTSGERR